MSERLVEEDELRAALRARRPDPDAFQRAVREKLEAAEAAAPPVGKAAAFLPPGLLQISVAGIAGKPTLGKLGASLVALPVLVLLMTALTFVAGVRSLRRLDASRDTGGDDARALHEALGWWRAHGLVNLAVLVFMLWLALAGNVDLLLGILVVSMGFIVFVLRSLSSRGWASRRLVGAQCGGFLGSLAMWVWMATKDRFEPGAGWAAPLAYALMLGGGFACMYLALPAERDVARNAMRIVGGLVLAPLVLLLFLLAPLRTGASAGELRAWAEEFAAPPGRSAAWGDLRDVALALRALADGDPRLAPDLARAEAAYRAGLARGEDVSPIVDGYAAELGLFDERDWPRLLADHRAKGLFAAAGPVTHLDQRRAALEAACASGVLDAAQRDVLARRLVATWDGDEEFANLSELAELCRALERIERGAAVEELARPARAALARAWLSEGARVKSQLGGFVRYYQRGAGEERYTDQRTMTAALELLARFGVPEEIDLTRVRAHVAHGAQRRGLTGGPRSYELRACLNHALFEHELGARTQPPSLLERVLALRLLIGVALLVGLCVYATGRAPRAWG